MTPAGTPLRDLVESLLAIPRSLTGDGVRASLAAMQQVAPFVQHEVPTGTQVFDWTVPDEWNLRRGTLTGPDGTVLADSDVHPLHVMGYSEAVDVELSLDELQPRLHSLPDQPDAIPYRTSYYKRSWGFSLPDRVREGLVQGTYRATIEASLEPGRLTWGELVLPGESEDVVLLTTHLCHPAMANDNASGMALLATIGRELQALPDRRWTYHLVANPGTIGSLVWLSQNPDVWPRVVAGVTLAGVGDRGAPTWKRTFKGDAWVDRVAETVIAHHGGTTVPFSPWGYDERQYNAPAFRLPVGHLGRTPHGTYPEYHTSLDDIDFVTEASLTDSLKILLEVIDVLEHDEVLHNLAPHGEPRLGARGLYPSTGGTSAQAETLAMLWVLTMADGEHSLLDTSRRAEIDFQAIRQAAHKLLDGGLLGREAPDSGAAT